MKKQKLTNIMTLYIALLCSWHNSFSQATSGNFGNVPQGGSDYLGWTGGTNRSLDIKNNDAYPIDFYANGTKYMTILGSTNPGYVGIGITAPTNLLHINAGLSQITNSSTGSTSGDGLLIGQSGSTVEINQQENSSMKLLTNGIPRIHIESAGTGTASGYVGIGNSFNGPQSRLHINQGSNVDCWFQMTTTTTGNANPTDGFRIGVIDGSSGNVEIKQQENADMLFHTNNSERMRILSGGNVGIGYSGPSYKLDISGDVGLGNLASIYSRSDGGSAARVFSVSGNTSTHNGQSNVVAGVNAGPSSLSGVIRGVYVGYNAGNDDQSNSNTFIGYDAGSSLSAATTSGEQNVFLGYNAGLNMATGSYNFIAGARAGSTASFTGNYNSIIGYLAGSSINTSGADANVMLGYDAGHYITGGDLNCMIGYASNIAASGTAHYRGAFGAEARADCDTCIGIGSYYHRTGIGTYNPETNARLTVHQGTGSPYPQFTYSAYFYGNMYCTGTLTQSSDETIKENISAITDVNSILDGIAGYSYTFDTVNYGYAGLPSGTQYGLISQEVEQVLPGAVSDVTWSAQTDAQGLHPAKTVKALNYNSIIAVLVQAAKEQKSQIEDLQDQITNCCNSPKIMGSPANETGSIELENIKTMQLEQNDPNPFDASTMVRWNIDVDFSNAVLFFYDNSGNRINTYNIHEKGAGELQIFGSKLSSGVYTYTLVVDGKIIDSKKMVKAH